MIRLAELVGDGKSIRGDIWEELSIRSYKALGTGKHLGVQSVKIVRSEAHCTKTVSTSTHESVQFRESPKQKSTLQRRFLTICTSALSNQNAILPYLKLPPPLLRQKFITLPPFPHPTPTHHLHNHIP